MFECSNPGHFDAVDTDGSGEIDFEDGVMLERRDGSSETENRPLQKQRMQKYMLQAKHSMTIART